MWRRIAEIRARRLKAEAAERKRLKDAAASRKADGDRERLRKESELRTRTEAAGQQQAVAVHADPGTSPAIQLPTSAGNGAPGIKIRTERPIVRSAEVTQLSNAAARRRLNNGFEIITSRISGDIQQAWQESSRFIPADRIEYKRIKENWFVVSWTNEDVSHYLFGLPGNREVGMVHIKSPLDGRKTLTPQSRQLVAKIACSTYFGDSALPCARQPGR